MALFLPMIYKETVQQGYDIPAFWYNGKCVKTNTDLRTPTRGPGEPGGAYIIETILERIAHQLGADPNAIRDLNLLPANAEELKIQSTGGHPITNFTIPKMWEEAKQRADLDKRAAAVKEFNANNRWRKRGVAISPVKYHVQVSRKAAMVNLYADGSVVIHHTCNEMGQGLNTKAIQAASHFLCKEVNVKDGIDLKHFRIADSDGYVLPNGFFTGGSTSSEGTVLAIQRACGILAERLGAVSKTWKDNQAEQNKDKSDFKPEQPTWTQLTAFATDKMDCSATYCTLSDRSEDPIPYHNYGAAVNEVEIDVLTGEVELLHTEIVYDCGKSLNPNIDIGQAEGAFMMGVGHMFHEEADIYDEKTGELHSIGTWEYKPPLAREVPQQLNIKLIPNDGFTKGVGGSKSVGEPPLVLAIGAAMAVRQAVTSARSDMGMKEFAEMAAPMLPSVIANAAGTKIENLTLA
eukprot:TRINITY_DN66943_c9_g1_i1.p2 TRINITY_DN66943_c9_g1~~TRINITY_DN66943_c9_g1_i1.p2  ORF type:complete len:462 (-),score=108.84 TRINITY_DN66943_c9_g1_i1:2302-3687(-)